MITHLESDILEFEVKWVLGNIPKNKGSGCDGIQVELFQILKDDAVKVLHSPNMPANLENSAVATGWKQVSFHSHSKERQCQRMLKLSHNFTHLTSLVTQMVKCLPTMRETWVQFLGQEDPLEKEMATHSSTLVWRIP